MFALVAIAALFSFSMATPYYAAGYCADVHDQCTTTSWINDCSYNPSVRRQCPQTCGLCTYSGYFGLGAYPGYAAPAYVAPVCTDAIEGCADLAAAGWCKYEFEHGHKGLVSTQCKRTCGFCGIYKK